MGSASPGLSNVSPGCLLLSPDVALRTGVEKAEAGAVGPEKRDWSPSPPATPEQGLSAFYLSYFNMYPEDGSWVAKVPEASAREEPLEEPEQCPVIDSQASASSLDEHSLEQVQSMVVGEVLKDIETACKLLNITAGETLPAASPGDTRRVGIRQMDSDHTGQPRTHSNWSQGQAQPHLVDKERSCAVPSSSHFSWDSAPLSRHSVPATWSPCFSHTTHPRTFAPAGPST